MILKKLKLRNFRAYKNFEVAFDDSINVIIGRNDIGKSTILEALEIFFNSEKFKMEVSDLCVYAEDETISISCCFDVGDGKILIDSTYWTNCACEYLLNEQGLLEIKKTWDCSGQTISKSSQKDFIVAHYPTAFDPPLKDFKFFSIYMFLVFPCLTYLTYHNTLKIHPCFHKWQGFHVSHG